MRKRLFSVVLVVLCAVSMLFAGGDAEAKATTQKAGKQQYMTMAAVASSSGLFPYIVSIGKVINTHIPEYSITVSESGGNVDNTKRLRNGEVKIANSISNTDYESYTGTGTTFGGDPFTDFRILWYYEKSPIQICVAKDAGIKTIWDLDGKSFNPGGTGTAASVVIHAAFDALGIKPKYFEAGQADAADAYANRQIVGTVKTGPYPDSFVMQINASRPCDVLDISAADLARILEAIPSVKTAVVPSGVYTGVDHDANTLSTYQGIQVDMSFSQEMGYRLFKAMWEDGKSIWQSAYPVGATNDVPEMTLQAASTPLHAGTVQYLKEHGYTVPAHLIPPEYKEK
ncbi:MAG: TAXI family TRAP transporter solute-binding subunit [Sphaerochaeta sp.]|jgi:TRAP transporter TAXI family solute receptor|nr:TAXI family TRAP transporter solute-binding subunit [Sphaerochaeta sp.]